MKQRVFALYKGDKFIDLGTYDYLSAKLEISRKNLHSIKSKTKQRLKNPGNKKLLIEIS